MTDETPNAGTQLLGKVHGKVVHQRRVTVLADRLAAAMPESARQLLDVGCGDGRLDLLLQEERPGLAIEGVEALPRADCAIPCKGFNGVHLPFPDGAFDGCMFVDVLHHTLEALPLLLDACRVSRSFVLIKDHLDENALDHWTLRLMDWVGNSPHGVALPYAYLSAAQWKEHFGRAGLRQESMDTSIPLYPSPFSMIFGRKLHFVALLKKDAKR